MKTNGVVRRLMSRPPGLERWEAQCSAVLVALGGTAPLCVQERSNARDRDALEDYSQVEPDDASGRRARTVSHQRFSAWC